MIGIYGIFRKSDDKCMYVGQSKDVNERIKAHTKGKNPRFNEQEYYGQMIEQHFINDRSYRLDREAYWIKELNPELNEIRDRHHSEDINKRISEAVSGEKNPMYGKNAEDYMTLESIKEKRKKQSEANKGKHHPDHRGEKNPMYGKHPTAWNRGISPSKESKEKNRQAHLGTKWINNGEITKHVNQEELDKYIQDGWKLGRLAWKRNS